MAGIVDNIHLLKLPIRRGNITYGSTVKGGFDPASLRFIKILLKDLYSVFPVTVSIVNNCKNYLMEDINEMEELKAKAAFIEDYNQFLIEEADKVYEGLERPEILLLWTIQQPVEKRASILDVMIYLYEKDEQFEKCSVLKKLIENYLC